MNQPLDKKAQERIASLEAELAEAEATISALESDADDYISRITELQDQLKVARGMLRIAKQDYTYPEIAGITGSRPTND